VADDPNKYELECLRFAADCTQLARLVRNENLRRHFLRMADSWRAKVKGSEAHLRRVGFAKPTASKTQ
jgi:hypothetical protein